MSGADLSDIPGLKRRVAERVAAGETLLGVCAEAGMPGLGVVRKWRRVDGGFATVMAEAVRVGAWKRLYRFDEAKAAAFLARAWAGPETGETINDILAAGDPAMPSRFTYRFWKASNGPFACAVAELRARRNATLAGHGRAGWRAFDPRLADRIVARVFAGTSLLAVLEADPALPCVQVVGRWRRESARFDMVLKAAMERGRKARGRDQARQRGLEVEDALFEGVIEGGSVLSLAGRDGLPSARAIYGRVARDEKLADRLALARKLRRAFKADDLIEVANLADANRKVTVVVIGEDEAPDGRAPGGRASGGRA